IPGRDSTAAMLVRAGFVVVLVLVNVSGFRSILARGWHDQLTGKWVSYRASGSTRRSIERSRVRVELWLCRVFEGDRVAEGFELADVAAHAAVGVDAGGVEIGAEVDEAASVQRYQGLGRSILVYRLDVRISMRWSRASADPWLTVSARRSSRHLARVWPV